MNELSLKHQKQLVEINLCRMRSRKVEISNLEKVQNLWS